MSGSRSGSLRNGAGPPPVRDTARLLGLRDTIENTVGVYATRTRRSNSNSGGRNHKKGSPFKTTRTTARACSERYARSVNRESKRKKDRVQLELPPATDVRLSPVVTFKPHKSFDSADDRSLQGSLAKARSVPTYSERDREHTDRLAGAQKQAAADEEESATEDGVTDTVREWLVSSRGVAEDVMQAPHFPRNNSLHSVTQTKSTFCGFTAKGGWPIANNILKKEILSEKMVSGFPVPLLTTLATPKGGARAGLELCGEQRTYPNLALPSGALTPLPRSPRTNLPTLEQINAGVTLAHEHKEAMKKNGMFDLRDAYTLQVISPKRLNDAAKKTVAADHVRGILNEKYGPPPRTASSNITLQALEFTKFDDKDRSATGSYYGLKQGDMVNYVENCIKKGVDFRHQNA